jgi:hypothetical protein
MASVFWVFFRVWEVSGGIRGIRSILTRLDLATFGSVLRRIRPSPWSNSLGSVLGLFFLLSISIFYFKSYCIRCIAYDRPGLSPRHFLVFYLCSRVGPLPYNPARHPAFIKAPRLLGSVPSYLLVLVVATADPHLLSASLLCSPRVTGWTPPVLEAYADLSILLASGKCLPKLRHLPGLSFFLSASFPLACEVQEARFHFLPTRNVCCACRIIPGWSSPSGARTGCFVRCDSSHDMSRCFGLSVQASALIALQCTWCLFVPTLAHL